MGSEGSLVPWYVFRTLNLSPALINIIVDGGGIRGYSALLIIGELMKKIKHIEQNMPPGPDPWDGPAHSSYHPVDPDQEMSTDSDDSASDSASKMAESSAFLPCHYFDYIAGTSTGGLISIMLGRLRMSVDECIEEYRALGDEVFGKRRIFHLRSIPPIWLPREKYNHKNLEAVIQDLVKRKVPKIGRFPGGRNFEFDENRCRVVVVAYQENPESGTEQTYLFRTYKNLRKPSDPGQAILYRNPGPADDIEIWKVARATSAAPSYFKEMTIEDLKYLDGGFGANNPCLEIYQEILNINNDNENCLGCILSIGTGKNDEKRLQSQAGFRESLKLGLGKYIRFENFARKWASESEAPHRAMLSNWRKSNEAFKYCRLNVVDGLARMKLDEWRRRSSARLAIGRNIGRCNRRMKSKKSLPQSAKDAQQLKLRRMKHEDDNESNATDSIAANDASDPKEELEKFIPDSYKPLNKTIETITKLTETYLAQQDCQDELDQIASHLVESRRARVRANPDRWQKTCFRTWYQCQVRGCPRGESEYPDAHAMRKHLLDKHKDKFSKHDDQAIQNLNKTILNFKITVR
ncbi:uncharacterized protein KY384_003849 [Bacidia gigantensis]|uniref:uncharacterized protein n=1 Tax=Bacidia gigantensis TaxID=2732470 RepID=UPI001D04C5B8|nr:uncharacterized protein KY384_003849 [Bacidia gigantensis]KAG8532208.1 hypothetical protein KY384_003849 [Bacidia gigantensis]